MTDIKKYTDYVETFFKLVKTMKPSLDIETSLKYYIKELKVIPKDAKNYDKKLSSILEEMFVKNRHLLYADEDKVEIVEANVIPSGGYVRSINDLEI